MHVYDQYSYCFVCTAKAKTEDVLSSSAILALRKTERVPTDIIKDMEYINGLRKEEIRSLQLPVDDFGYYVLWPDGSYYKKRLFRGSVRYICPKGRSAPLFAYPGSKETLLLVEGEINCMSLKYALPDCKATIASYGSASQALKYLPIYLTYNKVYVIVDKDNEGVISGLWLQHVMRAQNKQIQLIALETDLNDILVKGGVNAVQEVIKKEAPDLALQ